MTRDYTPHPYQMMIQDHIRHNPRCAVLAGMGMGKTVSTFSAVEAALLSEDGPVLVLAPLRVARTTWPEEAGKWSHLSGLVVVPIVGDERARSVAVRTPADVYTTNYEQLPWLVEHWGDRWPYRIVIADESTKLKSFRLRQGGSRAQALGKVAHSNVARFIALTGTPAPNGLQDLWGQMWFLDKGQRLGRTFDAFRSRWFTQHPSGFGIKALPHAQAEIQAALADLCITVEAKDWFDLREARVNNIFVDLPMSARRHYREMEREMFTQLAGLQEVEALNAAAKTQKCLQMANGAVYTDDAGSWTELHDAKLQALESVIEESATPVLVAYHFKSDLARLLKAFPKGRHLDADPKTIRDWNAGRTPVLFAHPASAGHGLNLQDGGCVLVYFGHWWNLEERMQILERIGPTRQLQAGHDRVVWVHNIIARDTVDELVIERVESKREVQDILLAAMKRRAA